MSAPRRSRFRAICFGNDYEKNSTLRHVYTFGYRSVVVSSRQYFKSSHSPDRHVYTIRFVYNLPTASPKLETINLFCVVRVVRLALPGARRGEPDHCISKTVSGSLTSPTWSMWSCFVCVSTYWTRTRSAEYVVCSTFERRYPHGIESRVISPVFYSDTTSDFRTNFRLYDWQISYFATFLDARSPYRFPTRLDIRTKSKTCMCTYVCRIIFAYPPNRRRVKRAAGAEIPSRRQQGDGVSRLTAVIMF